MPDEQDSMTKRKVRWHGTAQVSQRGGGGPIYPSRDTDAPSAVPGFRAAATTEKIVGLGGTSGPPIEDR